MTTHTPSADLFNLYDTDRSEGGLFLCESDLISAIMLPHHSIGSQASLPEGAAVATILGGWHAGASA